MSLNTNIGPERVQVFEKPLGTVQVPGVATSVTAFLISTSLSGATVNTPTAVVNLEEFESAFGTVDDIANDAYYAVQGFFDNAGTGNTAIIVNVGDNATPNDYIGSASASSGLRSLDAQDVLGLVCVPGLPLEQAYLVQPSLIDYTETVRAEFGATLSTSFSLLAMPKEISKANKDVNVTTGTFLSSSGSGPFVIQAEQSGSLPEVTEFTFASPGSAITGGQYLTLSSANDATSYYVWVTVDAAGSDPAPGGTAIGPVALVSGDTTNDVATKIAAAINAEADFSAPAPGANVVTVTNDAAGLTTDATAGDIAGASVNVTQQGTDSDLDLSSVTAGMIIEDDAQAYTGVITSVNDVTDQITVSSDPSATLSNGDNFTIKIPSAVTYKETIINNPSRTAAWYFNNAVVTDRSDTANPGDILAVDPVGHVAGIMARIDANISIGGVSHAPAGILYAGLAGVVDLSLNLSERVDAEPLRLNFINRLTEFPGAGNIVFGGYTADSGTSPLYTADEQLIQVIRSIQYIKSSLEPGLRSFLWENFSPQTQTQVESAISAFLRNNIHLFPAGLPQSQQFQVIRVEATQDELDQGLLKVRVQVRPNKAVRFIQVDLEFPIPVA